MGNNKEKKHNNQFKENANHGEVRNGRLSQFKNHSLNGHEPNEYVTDKVENEEENLNT
ncbi:hypothetical protein JCM19046_5097 [Bacillus sp. JCM 19046]|uniref:GON domain-containing protein n=1 Tax=Shouchella xiaoxiensis TaxID=766895 RepID=A0ABS2SUI6_9BACI|nr:hypothetical protein [Shouchella xiaoxiensis]MBM7838134.1 hypothetical protein [Shouchella xiaoxiensis]GAF12011.1 hypothetical protein JCM19045_1167 [Bacillus sp. JCM 19045]GAF20369.1 hypothetical protein JCM19046_5097 [Bacillus sp. JCM 19046]